MTLSNSAVPHSGLAQVEREGGEISLSLEVEVDPDLAGPTDFPYP